MGGNGISAGSEWGIIRACIWIAALGLTAGAPAQQDGAAGAEQYYSGNALYNRNLYTLAIQEYRGFLRQNPNHPKAEDARKALGLSLYAAGKYGEAEPVLAAAVRAGKVGDIDRLKLLRAQCLQELGNLAEAGKAYADVAGAASDKPQRADALAALADLAFRQKQWQEAADRADQLVALDAENAWIESVLYQGAYARYQLGQTNEALRLLGRTPSPPRDAAVAAQATLLEAELHREGGRFDAAADAYTRLLKSADDVSAGELWFRLGYVRFRAARYGEAVDALRKSLERKPPEETAAQAALLLGRALMEKGDLRAAADTLRPLAQRPDASGAEATLWLARCSSRQGKSDEAAAVLGPALGRFSKTALYPDLLFDHATALMAKDAFADAAKSLNELMRFNDWPQRADALRLQAVCLNRAGDYAGSLQAADRFLGGKDLDPAAVAEVAFARAEDLFFLDRVDDALAAYRAFVQAHGTHASAPAATYRVVSLLHRKGTWEEALKEAEPLLKDPKRDPAFSQLDFMTGDALFKLERWDEAIQRLSVFVDANRDDRARRARGLTGLEPNVDTALVEMGVAQLRLQRADRAAASLAALVQRFGDSPHAPLALAELGRIQYEAGDFRNARQNLEKLGTAFPKAPQRTQGEYYLAWTAVAEGKNDEAVKRFDEVSRVREGGDLASDAGLQAGLILLGQDKYGEARNALQAVLRTWPKHPQRNLAVFSLGVALARQKAWKEAAAQFGEVLNDASLPDELAERSLYELAWCQKGLDRRTDAVATYRKLIEAHPDGALADKARTELAELTFDAKEYDTVIAELRATLDRVKDDRLREQAFYRLGTAYWGKNDLAESANTFEALLKAYPKSGLAASAHVQAGECRLRLKELATARDHFGAAARSQGDAAVRESAWLRLGETEGLLGRWRESAAAYEELLRAFPQTKWAARGRFGLAWAIEKQGDFRRALAEYGKVVAAGAKDELSARSQFQVGECWFALKDYDRAVQEFVRVPVTYRNEDWSAKAALEMGRALEAKGDREKAKAQFREVLQKYPRHDAAVVARERLDALRRDGA